MLNPGVVFLFSFIVLPSVSLAGAFTITYGSNSETVIDGKTYKCDGMLQCWDENCYCNFVKIEGVAVPCNGKPTIVHPNGGGTISRLARIADSVYLSKDSTVCGEALISDQVIIQNGSAINATARITGKSILTHTIINKEATIHNSVLDDCTINDRFEAYQSKATHAQFNSQVRLDYGTEITGCSINSVALLKGKKLACVTK
ncbi:hypothetical protein K2X30_13880 [bacterium]|jgi:NDP-sugar pyrophosphorylase family protein|nr:hypothetical protein [bacterium]